MANRSPFFAFPTVFPPPQPLRSVSGSSLSHPPLFHRSTAFPSGCRPVFRLNWKTPHHFQLAGDPPLPAGTAEHGPRAVQPRVRDKRFLGSEQVTSAARPAYRQLFLRYRDRHFTHPFDHVLWSQGPSFPMRTKAPTRRSELLCALEGG